MRPPCADVQQDGLLFFAHRGAGMSTYSEKFRDPRWQKKRLEVLESCAFECTDCGSRHNTLHVHHCYYEKGLDPWEYPSNALTVLCGTCHKKQHKKQDELFRRIGRSQVGTELLLGFMKAADGEKPSDCNSYEEAAGFAAFYKTTTEKVIGLATMGEDVSEDMKRNCLR